MTEERLEKIKNAIKQLRAIDCDVFYTALALSEWSDIKEPTNEQAERAEELVDSYDSLYDEDIKCEFRRAVGDFLTHDNIEQGHTYEEYMEVYGVDYNNGDLWDFTQEDIENGAVEMDYDRIYWFIDGRYYETNEFMSEGD